MSLSKLYIFVEGIDDLLFFEKIIRPIFLKKYDDVDIIQYAQMKRIKVQKFIESIITLGFDYLLVADIDFEPSVKSKIKLMMSRFAAAEYERIIVVIAEIESWYLAGISSELARNWRVRDYTRTELVVKEEFNQLYSGIFKSRIDFMSEILKCYDLSIAITKNSSLKFFYSTYVC